MAYVFFDLGNVLVHFDPLRACRNVAALVGCGPEDVEQEMYASGLELRYERGEFSDEEFVAALCQRLAVATVGAPVKTAEILEAMGRMFTPHTAMEEILASLQQRGVPMGILSNTCAAHWRWIQDQQWRVSSGWFRDAVLSYEVGCLKPEAEIYRVAASLAGVPAAKIFFTDDREENVAAARGAGWHAVLFTDPDQLRTDLAHFGIPLQGTAGGKIHDA